MPRHAAARVRGDLQRAVAPHQDALQVAADAGSGMPWHPGQVILEDSSRSAAICSALIDDLDPAQLDVLEKLLEGSPMGRTRDTTGSGALSCRGPGCSPRSTCPTWRGRCCAASSPAPCN
ncbi:hypothetical protein MAHJHV57_51830 [Mycobacterium avium subsp. hominissuis]